MHTMSAACGFFFSAALFSGEIIFFFAPCTHGRPDPLNRHNLLSAFSSQYLAACLRLLFLFFFFPSLRFVKHMETQERQLSE